MNEAPLGPVVKLLPPNARGGVGGEGCVHDDQHQSLQRVRLK